MLKHKHTRLIAYLPVVAGIALLVMATNFTAYIGGSGIVNITSSLSNITNQTNTTNISSNPGVTGDVSGLPVNNWTMGIAILILGGLWIHSQLVGVEKKINDSHKE